MIIKFMKKFGCIFGHNKYNRFKVIYSNSVNASISCVDCGRVCYDV